MIHTQPEKSGGLSTHRSNPCLFFLNQEKAAIKSLVGLAEGYRAHFHPVSQLKKQVSRTRAIGRGVHGSCGRDAHGSRRPGKPDLRGDWRLPLRSVALAMQLRPPSLMSHTRWALMVVFVVSGDFST